MCEKCEARRQDRKLLQDAMVRRMGELFEKIREDCAGTNAPVIRGAAITGRLILQEGEESYVVPFLLTSVGKDSEGRDAATPEEIAAASVGLVAAIAAATAVDATAAARQN